MPKQAAATIIPSREVVFYIENPKVKKLVISKYDILIFEVCNCIDFRTRPIHNKRYRKEL